MRSWMIGLTIIVCGIIIAGLVYWDQTRREAQEEEAARCDEHGRYWQQVWVRWTQASSDDPNAAAPGPYWQLNYRCGDDAAEPTRKALIAVGSRLLPANRE